MKRPALPPRMPVRLRLALGFLVVSGGVNLVRAQVTSDGLEELTLRMRRSRAR